MELQSKDARLSDCFVRGVDGVGSWQVVVHRHLNDWELLEYAELMKILSAISLGRNEDTPRWKLTKNGNFTVKSWYRGLMQFAYNGFFPHKQI